ncbi:MAG: response regulator [Myxococcota bacterium]
MRESTSIEADGGGAYQGVMSEQDLMRLLFDASPQGLALMDEEGLRLVNPAFERLLGAPQPFAKVHAEDRSRVERLLAGNEEDRQEILRVKDVDGERWLRCVRRRLTRSGQDLLLLTVNSLEDRDAASRLVAQQDREASMMAFAGGLAHEFNNILVSVLSGASMLQDQLPSEARVLQLCDMIADGAQKMAERTGKLLAYSGGTIFRPGPTKLGDVVRETLLVVKLPRSIQLQVDLDPTLPPLHGDGPQLKSILHAVLLNAVEALAGRPGKLWVSTRFEPSESFESAIAALEVRDDGPGMSTEVRERIFEPFFTTRFQGRGLGLAAAAGILKAHGAQVVVESELGVGSCFTFRFPVDLASTRPRRREREGPTERRLVVVDDDERVRRVMQRVLEQAGYQVAAFASGVDALRDIREGAQFDAMVVDIFMPDMGGDEVIRRVRGLSPQLPILVCSGYGQERALADVETGVVQEFIMKPFRNDAFLAAVERTVSCVGET